jgi:hypothetical protein
MKLNELLVLEHDPSLRLDPNNPNFGAQNAANHQAFSSQKR